MRALVCVAAIFLGGCISLPGSTPPPFVPAPAVQCVPMVAYTPAQDAAFANALTAMDAAKLPGYLIIEGYLTDYHNMRVANAKCQG
jgi:hypothetical protein